jgi:hydrogenase nickel incorporation protein HypA/HybF
MLLVWKINHNLQRAKDIVHCKITQESPKKKLYALCELVKPMHEFSISSEIVRTVLDAAEQNGGKKVLSVQLEIGEMALLNLEQVTFWIHELFRGSVAEGAKVKVKTIKARIRCQSCGYRGKVKSEAGDIFQHLTVCQCPKCGSFEIKVEKGRECTLRRIQAVK